MLRSLKFVILAEILELLIRPILLGGMVVGFTYIVNSKVTANTVININTSTVLLLFVVGATWLYHRFPHKSNYSHRSYDNKLWIKVSLPLLFVSSMQLVSGYSDTLMLGILSSYADSGIYSVAVRVASFCGFSLLAINMILAPVISELFFSNKHHELQRAVTLTTRAASLISLLICCVLIYYGKSLLAYFGDGFDKAYLPLLILLPGQFLNVCCGSVGLLLSLTGHQLSTAKILLGSSLLNVLLNFILIPHYGMVGAALANTLAVCSWNIVMTYTVSRKLGINSTVLGG
jgi:O-antigen/teichoic acid export membrane protein